MPWLRMDDGFITNSKLLDIGIEAKVLYVWGLGFCAKELTDGHLKRSQVRSLAGLIGLQGWESAADELINATLWEPDGTGYQVHDYLHYNPCREDELAKRQARAEAGSIGGKRSVEVKRQAKAQANASANLNQSSTPYPVPVPYPDPGTRIPDPEPEPETSAAPTVLTATDVAVEIMSPVAPLVLESPKPARKAKTPKTAPEFSPDCPPYQLAVYQREAILRTDPTTKVPPEKGTRFQKWCEPMDKLLRSDHREPDEIRAVIDFSQADEFWQPNVLCPGKLREKYDTLKRQMVRNRAPPRPAYSAPARPPVSNGSKGGLTPDEARALERLGIRKVAPAGGAGPGPVQPAL